MGRRLVIEIDLDRLEKFSNDRWQEIVSGLPDAIAGLGFPSVVWSTEAANVGMVTIVEVA